MDMAMAMVITEIMAISQTRPERLKKKGKRPRLNRQIASC
jgi:hypothetical protein